MKNTNAVVSRIQRGLIVAVTLAMLAIAAKANLKAQGGLTGTWSGTWVVFHCGGSDCSTATPRNITIQLTDTDYGFTGTIVEIPGAVIDGFLVNQTRSPVYTLRTPPGDAGSGCGLPLMYTGSGFLDEAANSLNGNMSAISGECRLEFIGFSVRRQS